MRSIPAALEALGRGAAAAAVAILALPLACQGKLDPPLPAASDPGGAPRRGGTLHLASFQELRGLDPAGPVDGLAAMAARLVYAGLVDYGDRGELAPDLAERWEVADEGRTYRFFLRPGVTMHDGRELTADDVRRSAERALYPSAPNPNRSYFAGLAGFEAFGKDGVEHLAGIAVEGRYAISFHLREPDATFLPLLTMPTLRPTCESAGERYTDRFQPCGAGPFKLPPGGWQRGTGLRLVRHEAYFRPGRPYLDAVEWAFNVQPAAQRFRFEDGALDILRDITQADQARFAADPAWIPLGAAEPDREVLGEAMNTRLPPFDDVEVRRAVAAAIDRDHYRQLKPSDLTVLTQLAPPGSPAFDPSIPGQRHDVKAALEHMRRAGYPFDPATGRGGWPKPIAYPLYDQGLFASTAQLLQQDLAKIGLRIELRMMSYPAFLAVQERPGGAALSPDGWEMDYPDPSSFFEPLFTSAAIGAESSNNHAFFSNPAYDDLVDRARHEVDPARRMALYRSAGDVLCDQAPWAFTVAHHFFDVRQAYVRGFVPGSVWPMDVARVWLDRPARGRTLGALGRPVVEWMARRARARAGRQP